MKVSVEPKPLHEPLAGGTPGATVTVEPMVAGHVTWPRTMMERPGGRLETLKLLRALLSGNPAATVPCPAFLIRHPSAGAILVDTGLHPSVATDGKENFGGLGNRFPWTEPLGMLVILLINHGSSYRRRSSGGDQAGAICTPEVPQ